MFAEVPIPPKNPVALGDNGFHPDITINIGSMIIGISNTVSDALLDKLFGVISHAR